jgi:hypothetical protein
MIRITQMTALLPILFVALCRQSYAYPIDPDPGPLTLTGQRDAADACVLVKCISAESRDMLRGIAGQTTFEIIDIARGALDVVQIGARISIRKDFRIQPGKFFLLAKSRGAGAEWSDPMTFSRVAFDYVKQAPPESETPDQRLRYFVRHLEHADPEIATDAFREFALARFCDLGAFAPHLPRDRLRQWLQDPNCVQTRIGTYGIMLGLCGNADDAEFLREWILRPSDAFRIGLDGLMSGYLLLAGNAGLDVLAESKLSPKDALFSEAFAAMGALRFLWKYAPGRLSPGASRQAMRLVLARPDLADIAVNDLAYFEDWSVLDRLMELYDKEEYDDGSTKRAIARFCMYAVKSAPAATDAETPPHVLQAKQFLAQLRIRDPNVMRQAEQFFFQQ